MNSSLHVTSGARLTYEQLLQNPQQDTPAEEFNAVLHPAAVNPGGITILPPPGSENTDLFIPQVCLMRAAPDAPQAYGLLAKNAINLGSKGRGSGWGEIRFAVVFPRVSANNNNTNNTNYGTFVFQAPTEHQAQYVAIKRLSKRVVHKYLSRGGNENPYKEIARMQELGDDIHVLSCLEALECDDYIYIVTPKACSEGTLKDVIAWQFAHQATVTTQTPQTTMDPDRVWRFFRQILNILLYLERHNICHHDVSPDNFLFLTPDRLVIFDLALSLRIPTTTIPSSGGQLHPQRTLFAPQGRFGTPPYMDPTVYMNELPFDGVTYDLWAAAILLYNMCTSHILYRLPHPVDVNFRVFVLARGLSSIPMNEMAVQARMEIMRAGPNLYREQHSIQALSMAHLNISPRAMEVLEGVLQVNPALRWTLAQVVESDYAQYGEH